ncbi:hypothetical protein ACIOC1_34150 [Streptomyces sp. NPDC088197]|uniref:hypothetical protein n=1 Tax=unclassified Streptomyces TaxID=2593676 RepID=UPI0036E523DA
MPQPKPGDLYRRYMAADKANTAHTSTCSACEPDQPCEVGAPIYERFCRLQDAYLAEQRRQQPRR